MEIPIEDKALEGFNEQAREKLVKVVGNFASDLIKEANRLETSQNTAGTEPEIISSMVQNADFALRRGMHPRKKSFRQNCFKIAASLLPAVAGAMYNLTKLQQDSVYLLWFIVVIVITILVVTVSYLEE